MISALIARCSSVLNEFHMMCSPRVAPVPFLADAVGSRPMPIAEINGHPLYFEDSGCNGPPVVWSHGFLMDHEMFAPQVSALAGEFRCVTWDERGFGRTPAEGPFTYWDSAADVLALLSHLDIERAVLGGMSQGGFISLRAALLAPERVTGLVLIDTQAGTEDPDHLPGYEAMN